MSSFISPSPSPSTDYDRLKDGAGSGNGCVVAGRIEGRTLPTMPDEEREAHIRDCAWLMEDAMRRWYESGCFSHRGEADRWRLLMEEAMREREQQRGAA